MNHKLSSFPPPLPSAMLGALPLSYRSDTVTSSKHRGIIDIRCRHATILEATG